MTTTLAAVMESERQPLPPQTSLKRDPDDEVQFLSEKPVKKRRLSGRKMSEPQKVQLPSPAGLLAGEPARKAVPETIKEQVRRLPSPTYLLARKPISAPLRIRGSMVTQTETIRANGLISPVEDRTGYLTGLPPSMQHFTFARAYHHSPQTSCFSPPVSPRTVPGGGHSATQGSDSNQQPHASRSYPDILNDETEDRVSQKLDKSGVGLGFFLPHQQHQPARQASIRGSADGAYEVPMLFPLSPMTLGPNIEFVTTTGASNNSTNRVGEGTHKSLGGDSNQRADAPSVDPSLLMLAEPSKIPADIKPGGGDKNDAPNTSDACGVAPGTQMPQNVSDLAIPIHGDMGLGAHNTHCELCAGGQHPPPLHPMYSMAPFMPGPTSFNQAMLAGPMPMGMRPPLPPLRPMGMFNPPPWAVIPGAGPVPVAGGPTLPAGYPPFPGYLGAPQQALPAHMMGLPTAFSVPSSSPGATAQSTGTGETAMASQTSTSPRPGINTHTPTKPPVPTSAGSSSTVPSTSNNTSTDHTTTAATTTAAAAANTKKHAQNLYVDIAESCEALLPLADIARRHGVSRQRVADVFAAVVQVPLLRCPTDKRRVGKLGVARMKEFNKGRKALLAAEKSSSSSQKTGGSGGAGSKAQTSSSSAASLQQQQQLGLPSLYEVAQFMGPLDVADVAGGEQGAANKGRW